MSFFWQPIFDVNNFKSDNWDNLRDEARREQLQALENLMAAEQGRKPRAVIIDPLSSNGGAYMTDGNGGGTIYVSENDLHNNGFECMDTVFHEGRHAYQDDVIHNRIANSEPEYIKTSWAHDDAPGCYISYKEGPHCDYFYQPQEADANEFTKSKMDDMDLLFANDPKYQEYLANRDYNATLAQAEGEQKYGVTNEQDIKDAVQRKVEERYQFQQNQIPNQPIHEADQILSEFGQIAETQDGTEGKNEVEGQDEIAGNYLNENTGAKEVTSILQDKLMPEKAGLDQVKNSASDIGGETEDYFYDYGYGV